MSTWSFSGVKPSVSQQGYPVISFSHFLTVSMLTMKLISEDNSSQQNDQYSEV